MSWKDDVWKVRKVKMPIKTPTEKYDVDKVIEAMTDQSVGIARYHRGEATIEESDIKDFLNTHGHNFIKKNGQTYDEIIGLLEDGGFNVR